MKKVGSYMYVHKSNIGELLEKVKAIDRRSDIQVAIDECEYKHKWNYEIIKYDDRNHTITFIQCPDFDSANEPTVGDSLMLKMLQDWTWTKRKARKVNPQIYHNKWMFVDQSFYKGFDVIESYNRTKLWNLIPDIKKHKSRIGNQEYWFELLDANGIEH